MLDPKWQVPDSHDITERDVVLPPPRGYLGTQPMLAMLSVRTLEDQAAGDGQIALFAWQVIAGAWQVAEQTIDRLANGMEMSGLELLILGHAYAATGLGGGAGFETAQRARKILKQPVTAQSIDASLLLAVTALPYGADRVRTLLDMLGAELDHATDEHRAVHALLHAAAAVEPTHLEDAYARFDALEDHFGVAQCALVAYARELAVDKQPTRLRGYLEHARYRFEADGRPEWAARTIAHALVPLVAEAHGPASSEVRELLGHAAALAAEAKSQFTMESVFRVAARLGLAASVTTLSQFEPPTFVARPAAAVAADRAGDAAAAEASTEASTEALTETTTPASKAKGKKTPAKKTKKRA